MSIVIDTPYRSTRGRKPSRPAFYYAFHNDAAGGTAVVDRFGNARDLTVGGTLGTTWTARRGFAVPNGTNFTALMSAGTGENYASQDVMGAALITAGQGLFVTWLHGWAGAYPSAIEAVLCLGRTHTGGASPLVSIGINADTGGPHITFMGVGASATTTAQVGGSSVASVSADNAFAVHLAATETGFEAQGYVNGVASGSSAEFLWAANGGAKPALSAFALPDGITIGARRGGSNPASPTFTTQRVGNSNSGTSRIACISAVNLAQASTSLAADLAMEAHLYRRHIGEILGAL